MIVITRLLLVVPVLLVLTFVETAARDNGQWAQSDPAERQWFREQHNPKTNIPCCSQADGADAQEDIRGEHYWTRYTASYQGADGAWRAQDSGWVEVPDDAVIRGPNKHGSPVVWYYLVPNGDLTIRCFMPGSGL